jgi:glycerol-3-phosphate dehydrogenase
MAVEVPDATMDPMRTALRFFATAIQNGARVRTFTEVREVLVSGGAVQGVRVVDHRRGTRADLTADIVINAAGAWSGDVAGLAGARVAVRPSAGVILALRGRLTNMVINRLAPAGDGDIIVPQRALSLVGTTSWTVADPDEVTPPPEHVERLYREGAGLVPRIAPALFRTAWAGVRPLIATSTASDDRAVSRGFACIDHRSEEGLDGFVSIAGGKATTARAMAEAAADLVCRKLGVDAECRTREATCLPYSVYYALAA